jgi:hypothetical protein
MASPCSGLAARKLLEDTCRVVGTQRDLATGGAETGEDVVLAIDLFALDIDAGDVADEGEAEGHHARGRGFDGGACAAGHGRQDIGEHDHGAAGGLGGDAGEFAGFAEDLLELDDACGGGLHGVGDAGR